jgi:holin-like protein
VPGGILAMGLLLALLLTGGLRKAWVRRGTSGLLDHMILFFVPAVMALLNHRDLLGMTGVKILAVIVASTLVVMVGTASVVELTMSWRQRHVG